MNWLMAHRVAGIAAANLLGRLDLPEDSFVDAFEALRRSGLEVHAQDMPSLFGVYLPPAPNRSGGILLNSTMTEATIRHSAAHELGHAEFGHEQCTAQGPDPFSGIPLAKWPDEEKQAEAFAAWFLMPMRAVKVTLTRLGLDIPREAMDVYQVSLHLGTSFRGTLRHLQHLEMVTPAVANGWRRVQPARLRARLSGQSDPAPDRVWDLTALTEGSRLHVQEGDRLIVRAPWLGDDPDFTGPDSVHMLPARGALGPGEGAEIDVAGRIDHEHLLTVTSRDGRNTWSATLMPTPEDHRGLVAAARPRVLIGPARGVRR